ncbi:MAG: DUF2130 domain-containing protein [Rickettsiales bacterium]|jgi:hypothetical protein|nr:DUF2130 domain-containing protein [Rickettsiales bacterium]
MIDPTIICPNCSNEVKLTDSLAAPIVQATRREYEAKIAVKEAGFAQRELDLAAQKKGVEDAQKAINDKVAEQLKGERVAIAAEEAKKAKAAIASDLDVKAKELSELQEVLKQRNEKLAQAQQSQADLLRKQRELDDAKRELDLTIEKKVQLSLAVVREKARAEGEDSVKLKVSEKEEQIASMQRQIEELRRKSEQGSQQLQGEVLELEIESMLQNKFPFDNIEPVAKGEFGGDIIQRVILSSGNNCGAILWESKRTKNWSDGWLTKLRGDQRLAKADISILISQTLPKNVKSFDCIDGVWIASPEFILPLVTALRQTLIEVSRSKQSQEGQQTKMALVYEYLTGPRFKHRVEAIVDKFSDMQADLDREKKAMTRLWAKRDAQIQGVIESTVGMYGDMQGIVGRALEEIEGLEMPLLDSPKVSNKE